MDILKHYEHEPKAVCKNLCRFFNQGHLRGSGKLLILPVDQGFEHGPAASFAMNPDAYDPEYHAALALEGGASGYAAPLGALSAIPTHYSNRIPLILKLNNLNSLHSSSQPKSQAETATVEDAVRLGCAGVGLTIYPGSESANAMFEYASRTIREARRVGLPTFVWSYPRGGDLDKQGETALDVAAYAAHIAASLGAQVVKIKAPSNHIHMESNKYIYSEFVGHQLDLSARIAHVKAAALGGRRIVIFSGGARRDRSDLLDEIENVSHGGGDGSIVGRNVFQRPKFEAISLMQEICDIYRSRSEASLVA